MIDKLVKLLCERTEIYYGIFMIVTCKIIVLVAET
jgi:hypothetical protein